MTGYKPMRYKVIREFKDKFRQIRYYPGDTYTSDDPVDPARIDFLSNEGYLGEEIPPAPPSPEEPEPEPEQEQEPEEAVKPNADTGRRKNRTKD